MRKSHSDGHINIEPTLAHQYCNDKNHNYNNLMFICNNRILCFFYYYLLKPKLINKVRMEFFTYKSDY